MSMILQHVDGSYLMNFKDQANIKQGSWQTISCPKRNTIFSASRFPSPATQVIDQDHQLWILSASAPFNFCYLHVQICLTGGKGPFFFYQILTTRQVMWHAIIRSPILDQQTAQRNITEAHNNHDLQLTHWTAGLLLSSKLQNQLCVCVILSPHSHSPTLKHLTSLVNGCSFYPWTKIMNLDSFFP